MAIVIDLMRKKTASTSRPIPIVRRGVPRTGSSTASTIITKRSAPLRRSNGSRRARICLQKWYRDIRASHRAWLLEEEHRRRIKRAQPLAPLQRWLFGITIFSVAGLLLHAMTGY